MTATLERPGGRGRPRDPRHDAAIRDAALSLLAEVGYDRMTVDAIAAAAGVSKPTIYRRWPGKQQLVADAIRLHPHTRAPAPPDTGDLRGDLLAVVRQFADQQRETAHIALGLASEIRASAELRALVREHSVGAVRSRFATVLERAAARGELAHGAPISPLFADVAPSLVYTRVLLRTEPVDDAFIRELVDHVLLPIVLSPAAKEPR